MGPIFGQLRTQKKIPACIIISALCVQQFQNWIPSLENNEYVDDLASDTIFFKYFKGEANNA